MLLLAALAGCQDHAPAEAVRNAQSESAIEKPKLALLTSLPLVFGEGFSLEGNGSPVLGALEQSYEVEPIAVADAASLDGHDLLLMAHASAQPAEALVELDEWVRGGGKVLLLADPKLEWPSSLPLGDRRRPLRAFPDTGLLGHWGVRLEGPLPSPPAGGDIATPGRGRFEILKHDCKLMERTRGIEELVAHCSVGQGHVLIIADADFMRPEVNEKGGARFLLQELNVLKGFD